MLFIQNYAHCKQCCRVFDNTKALLSFYWWLCLAALWWKNRREAIILRAAHCSSAVCNVLTLLHRSRIIQQMQTETQDNIVEGGENKLGFVPVWLKNKQNGIMYMNLVPILFHSEVPYTCHPSITQSFNLSLDKPGVTSSVGQKATLCHWVEFWGQN